MKNVLNLLGSGILGILTSIQVMANDPLSRKEAIERMDAIHQRAIRVTKMLKDYEAKHNVKIITPYKSLAQSGFMTANIEVDSIIESHVEYLEIITEEIAKSRRLLNQMHTERSRSIFQDAVFNTGNIIIMAYDMAEDMIDEKDDSTGDDSIGMLRTMKDIFSKPIRSQFNMIMLKDKENQNLESEELEKIQTELMSVHIDSLLLDSEYFNNFSDRAKNLNASSCQVNHLWGHGSDLINLRNQLEKLDSHNNGLIGQGCSIGNYGNVSRNVNQPAANGVWMSGLSKDYNGGFNPNIDKNCLEMPGNSSYSECEINALKKLLLNQKGLKANETYDNFAEDLRRARNEVNAVGFMKLTERNWLLAMNHAEYLFQNACMDRETIRIAFHCWEDFSTNQLRTRRSIARSNRTGIVDSTKAPVRFHETTCGKLTDGTQVDSIPPACTRDDEGYYFIDITREDLRKLKTGPCRRLFSF